MSSWQERMDQEAQEAKKAADEKEQKLSKSQAEIKKYIEEKWSELMELAGNIAVKDILTKVKDFWGPETWIGDSLYFSFPTRYHEVFYPHKLYHNAGDSIVYPGTVFERGQTDGLVELIFRAINDHSFTIPGRPAHVITHETLISQGGSENTYKLEHPRHIPAVPDRTGKIRSEFGIALQVHSRDERKTIYAYDKAFHDYSRSHVHIPSPSPSFSMNLSSGQPFQSIAQQLEEYAYRQVKYRKEHRMLPSDLRRITFQ